MKDTDLVEQINFPLCLDQTFSELRIMFITINILQFCFSYGKFR